MTHGAPPTPNVPPDLTDPLQRAAYRRELRGIARPIRWLGSALALAGAVLAVLRAVAWPAMPMAVPLVLIGAGALNMVAGVAIRTKYHQARMKA